MGINRGAVIDLELEPMVQVGTANDVSGFPFTGRAQQHRSSVPWM